MVGWHHQLDECEFEQAPGVFDRHGSLACCSPWGHEESNNLSNRIRLKELEEVDFCYFRLIVALS